MPIRNQKIENILNMALAVTPSERARSINLETGYLPTENKWKVIVKFTGDLTSLQSDFPDVQITILSNQYGILIIPESQIEAIANSPLITYMEKPKRLFFSTFQARQASCITVVQSASSQIPGVGNGLDGYGILIGIIDSGIDYAHPDFRNEDGTTRILELWDQTLETVYTQDTINRALEQNTESERLAICPSRDLSGHGTHVAGIAAGNGRASDGIYRGVAYRSDLLVVKLGVPDPNGFPSTTELMEAIDFCVRKAELYGRPLALNLSFGNNYGSHSGTSLLETFINDIAGINQNCICVGTGNEGSSGGHTGARLSNPGQSSTVPPAAFPPASSSIAYTGSIQRIEFAVSAYETTLNIQLWKNYVDEFRITISDPSGSRAISIDPVPGTSRYTIGSCELLVFYGEPAPYSRYQEIYFDFLPTGDYLEEGVWSITLTAQRIVNGIWDMWMPSSSVRSATTRFLNPTPDTTLTIPSTAMKSIAVSAYDSYYNALAAFSGRGYTWDTRQIKPDLAAPGVDINSCAPGGGYTVKSGTSMATPFVTGSAALLMQYGIGNGNDPFLYGEKVKAYLIRGARRISVENAYPNPELGWGVLCLRDALPS